MRTLSAVALLALSVWLSAPTRAQAEGPTRLELEVGEEKELGGFRPLCDDPSVAWFSSDGKGVLKALKVGETTCSISAGSPLGRRSVYRVVVVPPRRKGGEGGQAGKPGGA